MTKKERIFCILTFIICILLKEQVYAFLLGKTKEEQTNQFFCTLQNKELEKNYQELVDAYGYEEKINYPLEKSKVLYRSLYDLNQKITIYKGKKEGIQEKNLVINEHGVVGIIEKTNDHSSEVMLLENPNLSLSVKINDSYGILTYQNQKLIVTGLDTKQVIHENDLVYISDLSLYPKNLLIGSVKRITKDRYEIEQILEIEPAVDFKNLKYVSVITTLRGDV